VTGDHLSFDGNSGVRAQPSRCGRQRAIQRCVRPSLSSNFLYLFLVLSAGVGTPRDFMAPDTCGGTVTASSGTLKPDIGPATSVRPGACLTSGVLPHLRFNCGYFNCEVLVVLSFTCVVLLVLSWGRVTDGLAPSPRRAVSVSVFVVPSLSTRENITGDAEHVY